MPGTINDAVIEAVMESFSTMAFIVPTEPANTLPKPGNALLVRMRFYGPVTGFAELAAGMDFVERLAANILGVEANDPSAAKLGADAFKEMLNTICGILLPLLTSDMTDIFDVTLPEVQELCGEQAWDNFLMQENVSVLDADGDALAVRMGYR